MTDKSVINEQYQLDKKRYDQAIMEWEKQREQVRKENKRLIKEWESIPWYRFWERPSFEEQKSVIVNNWESIKAPKMSDYFNFPYLTKGAL